MARATRRCTRPVQAHPVEEVALVRAGSDVRREVLLELLVLLRDATGWHKVGVHEVSNDVMSTRRDSSSAERRAPIAGASDSARLLSCFRGYQSVPLRAENRDVPADIARGWMSVGELSNASRAKQTRSTATQSKQALYMSPRLQHVRSSSPGLEVRTRHCRRA